MSKELISLQMPTELKNRLLELAESENRSLAAQIRHILERHFASN